jgi:hypothetical protein
MKIVLAGFAVLLFLAACDEFKEAPLTKCGTTQVTVLAQELAESTTDTCPFAAYLVSRTEDKLVIDYQQMFICGGVKYGYDAVLDHDPTILDITILSERGDSVTMCACCKRMTVTYKAAAEKIAQITQVKILGEDDDWERVLPIEEE